MKLLVLRVIRPDKLVGALQAWVMEQLGRKFVEPPSFDLDQCFQDSSPTTPLIFVLSAGSDPMSGLFKYSDAYGIQVCSWAASCVLHATGYTLRGFSVRYT